MEASGLDNVDARRVLTLRLGAHATALTLATGLGLLLVGGTRSMAAWVVYASAAVIALLGVGWWGRRSLHGAQLVPRLKHHRAIVGGKLSHHDMRPPKTEEQLRESHDEIDYLMALRHELRTPLNAVLGFSDVLLGGIDGEVNESQREDLEIIRASGIRLRILLDSALDLSQRLHGELRLESELADVGEIVQRASMEAGQLWSNKREASCSVPQGQCFALVDEARLRRCILVLVDFLATSHRHAHLSVELVPSHGHLAIAIKAEPSDGTLLDSLPTAEETLTAEDVAEIRRWPLAVTSEVIAEHRGSLYHGCAPSRFLIRLPAQERP